MTTLSEITAKVQRRIIDLPTAITTEVNGMVNSAIRTLEQRRKWECCKELVEFTTTAGSNTLGTVPTNFRGIRGKPYYQPEAGIANQIVWATSKSDVSRAIANDREGAPMFVYVDLAASESTFSRSFLIYPLPDGFSDYSGGEYRVKLPYWKTMATLSGSSDSNWFLNNAEDFIVKRATGEGFALNWDEARSQFWYAQAEMTYKDIRTFDTNNRVQGVDTLVPHTNASDPRFEDFH